MKERYFEKRLCVMRYNNIKKEEILGKSYPTRRWWYKSRRVIIARTR